MSGTPAVRRLALPSGLDVWLVSGHAEARQVLADQRFAKDARAMARLVGDNAPRAVENVFSQALARHMLNTDPPEHRRLRALVGKEFTGRRLHLLRPRIERLVGELLDAVLDDAAPGDTAPDETVVDLISALAVPLPIAVICELLGVPDEDRAAFRSWSNAVVRTSGRQPRGADATQHAAASMDRYLRELIAAKRTRPGDDLVSALIAEGELTDDETAAMAALLLAAGHETTVNLIGNGVLALLTHPRRLAELRADRSLMPRFIEEFLRYDGPVNQATLRFTTEPVDLGGARIPADEFVMVNIDAANHDPRRHRDPELFDPHRDASGHLSFGHGAHYCLGAPLARLEAQIALDALLDRFERIELAVPARELDWHDSTLMRALISLPVRLAPHRRNPNYENENDERRSNEP